jgi:membrane protein implicated in regulation of membrane protease activity
MEFKAWWLWMSLAAIFIVGEIFTAGFFLMFFGISAAIAGVLSILGFGAGWQWGVFIVLAAGLFAVSRRFAERFSKPQPDGIGANRLIGKKGIVIEEINYHDNTGRVRFNKEEWRAESENGEIIPVNEQVIVSKLEGTRVIVNKLN